MKFTKENFPTTNLGRLVTISNKDGSSVRGFFMQSKPDKVYISIVDEAAHEWVKLENIFNVVWE